MKPKSIAVATLGVLLTCTASLASAATLLEECGQATVCAEACDAGDAACYRNCGLPEGLDELMGQVRTCLEAECPGDLSTCDGSACDQARTVVLLGCVGVSTDCIQASQCIETECDNDVRTECAENCASTFLEGEELESAQTLFQCATTNCDPLPDGQSPAECTDQFCEEVQEPYFDTCNFAAIDEAREPGGSTSDDDEVCEAFADCAARCAAPGEWSCLTECAQALPESSATQAISGFVACADSAGCTGPDDEACLSANCPSESAQLASACSDTETDGDEEEVGISQECTYFLECVEPCTDWTCVDDCKESHITDEDSAETIDDLASCALANACDPSDEDCLDTYCRNELSSLYSSCLEDDEDDEDEFSAACVEFAQCVDICSTWECTESCQSTSIADEDETINAAIDAVQACGASAECAPDNSDDCLDEACPAEMEAFEQACSSEQSGGDTGATGEGATDNSGELGGSGEQSSSDDDGCHSTQPSSFLTLFILLGALFYQRRKQLQPVRIQRHVRIRRRIR